MAVASPSPDLWIPEQQAPTRIWDLGSRDKIKFWITDPETGLDRQVDYVSPRNKWELQRWIEIFFGYKIASKSVCPGHSAPLDALWAAYNADARHSVVIWKASRGLGGKTTMLGMLGFLKLLDGANVVILGGSSAQSKRVHELSREAWEGHVSYGGHEYPNPFRKFLLREPTQYNTVTLRQNRMNALTASQRAVRGPHPQALLLDEIDEMDKSILGAAMGQTMANNRFPDLVPVTVMSSTHQYPNGTMTAQLNEARVKGWPVFEWCWRETSVHNGGWLTDEERDRKKNEVTAAMWEIEYDLQEPSSEGRVFPQESLNKLFQPELGEWKDSIGKTVYFERPQADAKYAHGSDWARKQDQTINVVLRTDKVPARVVAFHRDQKRPWPVIISVWDHIRDNYPGRALHDVTGIGDVIEGFFENSKHVEGFFMAGKPRAELFTDYTLAVEHDLVKSPVIATMFNEHKYCTLDDLYAHGNDDHPPDSIVATALAWRAHLGKFANPGGRVAYVGGF